MAQRLYLADAVVPYKALDIKGKLVGRVGIEPTTNC
jgi:hypothetical protein